MACAAIDGRTFFAELRPALDAGIAATAAVIVMHHDALTYRSLVFRCRFAAGYNHAAGLVSGDHVGIGDGLRPIDVQVGTAHARGLDLQHDFVVIWGRIGKFSEFQCFAAGEDDAFHVFLLLFARIGIELGDDTGEVRRGGRVALQYQRIVARHDMLVARGQGTQPFKPV